jgi:hypothetical protein
MTNIVIIDTLILFVQWTLPVVAVLSLVLFLRPKLFTELEKKLAKEFLSKKSSLKTISLLEKENMVLQLALQRNGQLVGLLCFILAALAIAKLYHI